MMQTDGPTMDELRALSRASRRASGWGAGAHIATLMLFPAVAVVYAVAPAWFVYAIYAALGLGGLLFIRYAHVAGQERGAFRKVFRRLQDDRRQTRSVPVAAGSAVKEEAPLAPQK